MFLFIVAPVGASEVCKEALKTYDVGRSEAGIADVLAACKSGHGQNATFLQKLLTRCERLLGGKASPDVIAGCKVDAYRYIGWDEYP